MHEHLAQTVGHKALQQVVENGGNHGPSVAAYTVLGQYGQLVKDGN